MRALVVLLLLVCMGAGGALILGGSEGGLPADAASLPPLSASDADPRALADAPARDEAFYQYVDERGSVVFVRRLEDVPPARRASAGRVTAEVAARARSARPAAPRPTPMAAVASRQHDVVVYTAPWCGWCRKTLAWLDEHQVRYENRDIEANDRWRAELVEKSGGTGIPLVEIDGRQIQGYAPDRMSRMLGL